MHLKYLDLTGFKSFAEKTRLEFETGTTAIVGPNGCGKSNVIDAIRWCLGEMSAKSLRSSVLLDVIFAGSSSRNAQNMAEVSLTFDNADHLLPIDYSEVTVSRRLYRSGESEYFLNKTQCRLKDIRELFLDTGMGEDGYSILEQGKVEYVLQAKPEARRELFEEAAGVSKYRSRRDEAQRKLEKVDIDLSRLADVITMTKDQMDRLEASVKKAQQYQKLEQEVKVLELRDLLHQSQSARENLEAFDARLQNAQESVQTLTGQVHASEAELQKLRLAFMQKQEEVSGAGTRKARLDGEKRVCEERLANARIRQEQLVQRRATLEKESEQNRLSLLQLSEQEQALAKERGGSESSYESLRAEVNEAGRAAEAAQERLVTEEAALAQVNEEILETARRKSQASQTLGHLRTQATRAEFELQNLYKDRTKAQIRVEELRAQVQVQAAEEESVAKDRTALSAELDRILEQKRSLEIDHKNAEEEIRKAQEAMIEIQGRLSALEEQSRRDPYASGAQALTAEGLPGLHGPVGRLIECPSLHKEIIKTALGDRAGYFLAETLAHAEEAIRFLAQSKKGRARFVVMDRLPAETGRTPLGSLRGERPLLDMLRFDPAFAPAIRFLFNHIWVSGAVCYGDGVIAGGVDPAHWPSGEDPGQEMAALAARRDRSAQAREAASERLRILREEMEPIEESRASLASKMNDVEVSFRVARGAREKAEQDGGLAREELEAIQEQIQRQQDELRKAESDIEAQEAAVREMEAREADLQGRRGGMDEKVKSALEEVQRLSKDLAALQGELKVRGDLRDMAETNWKRHQAHADSLKASLKASDEEMASSAAFLEEAAALEKEMGQKIAETAGLIMNHDEELRGVQQERDALKASMDEADQSLSSYREGLSAAQEKLSSERLAQSHEQARVDAILRKIQEDHHLSLEEAAQKYTPAPCDPEELERKKRRLLTLGPVNLAAPEEQAELRSRYDFLMAQQADLLKAKDDLQQVIQKINSTTRQSFRETFEKVRENFRAIYAQLFSGGEADLRLTEEADPLNAGVEIFAQPPGKKLQHISLLSGGEKALTATALLFAFFQTRPSPLALLDEVDAPLDEANVVRFAALLKSYSAKTQFVIISHNKRTMEMADSLYGVTMEEQGVSRVLSARLTKKAPVAEAATA